MQWLTCQTSIPAAWRSFPTRTEYDLLFDGCYSESSVKKWVRDRRPNVVVFVVWSALIVDGWVVVAWGRKPCVGPAEISSLCAWYNPRMGDTG